MAIVGHSNVQAEIVRHYRLSTQEKVVADLQPSVAFIIINLTSLKVLISFYCSAREQYFPQLHENEVCIYYKNRNNKIF